MNQYLQGIMTMLSLVNPVICVAIFSKLSAGKSSGAKIAAATQATIAIVVVLGAAALGGALLLQTFGISLDAFQVAGGMVLVWMGFIMLRGDASPTSANGPGADDDIGAADSSLTPLILFAASPGTITGVITLSVSHAKSGIPVTALVAVVVTLSITWLMMISTSLKSGHKKPGLVHEVTTRFMGLIVLAMGVQFALAGLRQFY